MCQNHATGRSVGCLFGISPSTLAPAPTSSSTSHSNITYINNSALSLSKSTTTCVGKEVAPLGSLCCARGCSILSVQSEYVSGQELMLLDCPHVALFIHIL